MKSGWAGRYYYAKKVETKKKLLLSLDETIRLVYDKNKVFRVYPEAENKGKLFGFSAG